MRIAGLLAGPYLLGLGWAAVSWPPDPVRATLCALAALAPLLLLLRQPAGPLVGYAAWGGPVITLLGAIGIAQARILARRSSFGFAEVEQDFLDAATDAQWLYGVLLGVAAALLVAASVLLHLRGADGWGPGLLAAGAVLQTAVLLMSTVYTPFRVGDTDEAVDDVVIYGPGWYSPAVKIIALLSTGLLIAGAYPLMRNSSGPAEK